MHHKESKGTVKGRRNFDNDQYQGLSLWQSEEWFYSLTEYIPGVSIQGYTTNGTVIFWNKASEEIYGYSWAEAIGKKLGDLIIPPDIKPHFKKALESSQTVTQSGELMPAGELMLLHKDGSPVPVYSIHTIICHPEKEPVLFCIDIDLSERKKTEAQLTQLTRTLADKNSHLESIIQIATHDLRTPMVNVVGFAGELNKSLETLQHLLNEVDIPEPARRQIHTIMNEDIPESLKFVKQGIGKMNILLKTLLRLAQLGMTVTHIEELDMTTLIRDAYNDMLYQARSSHADITFEPLPCCNADRFQMYCVFSNLLSNAIKYLDPTRKGKITISGTTENNQVVYCIEDNGIGIEPENIDNIFNVFYRSNNDREGEGIGLAIARRILDRHGGDISVESEIGKGSRFFVSIPAV